MSKTDAKEINKRLNALILDQTYRQANLERWFHMYGHSTISNSSPISFLGDRARFNLIQSGADTLLNKVSKNLPRATFLTDGGDWDKQQSAKKREKFVYGQFHKSEVYQKTKKACLQSLVYGDGFVKTYHDEKELKIDPVLTMAMIVDEKECLYGDPRTFYEIRYVDKETLKELYPSKVGEIEKLQSATMPFYMAGTIQHNLVQVVEYLKLPVRKGAEGEHCIVAGELMLYSESWKSQRPLYRRLGFMKNLVGWYSKGIAEIGTPWQLETNRTLKRISDALRLVATPKVLYEYNSKIVQAHFNNDVGAMIGYLGQPPQFVMPQAVGVELFQHLQYCVQSFYNDIGLSQLTANSEKPAGLNSGKALREYNDIETERFSSFSKDWEKFHVDISQDCLEVAKDIQKKYGKYSVIAPDKKGCEVINFKDIDMDQDSYVIQVYPTSQLPKDPSGRLEYVTELIAGQMVSPEEGLALLDFPDTEKLTSLKTSELDDILATIDYMLTQDKYLPPEPFQNLELGIQFMKKAYLKYKNQKCPDEKLDLLYRWVNDALVMLQPPEDPGMTADELVPAQEGMPVEEMPMEGMIPTEEQLPVEEAAVMPVM